MALNTNRTAEDVDKLLELRQKIILRTASEEEWQLWLSGLAGAMNIQDFNRLEAEILAFAQAFNLEGYDISLSIIEFAPFEYPSKEKIDLLLEQVNLLRNVLIFPQKVPMVPCKIFDYAEANTVEQVLQCMMEFIQGCQMRRPYCGEGFSGENWII